MERLLSQDERIRRAEEIYARRQNLRERTKRATVNVSDEPKNFRLLKKLALQITICMLMYFIFYLINTTNYSFSEEALNKTNEIISHDVDFVSIYNSVIEAIRGYIFNNGIEENQNNDEQQNGVEQNNENQDSDNEEQGEDGAKQEQSNKEEGESVSQENQDSIMPTNAEVQNVQGGEVRNGRRNNRTRRN